MAVYRGTAPLKAYKGDMQPVNVYHGSTKVAGWHSASYSGPSPLAVDWDYNVPPDALVINGKCVQTGTPSPSSPAPISTITGNVTITGADGAVSDTATVAMGSAVCASLPDGTKDTYDAVTGVLTKRVGKYVGASGTSWTISDAASGSSILSDCFGADVLSGTRYSAYDAACQPNLFPASLAANDGTAIYVNVGNATLSGDTFALTATGADVYFGEVGNPGQAYHSSYPSYGWLIPVKPSTIYTFEVFGNSSITKSFVTQYDSSKKSLGYGSLMGSTRRTFTTSSTCAYVTLRFGYGSSVSGTTYSFCVGLFKGDYTGDYKPYALPCAPTIYYALATPTTMQFTPHLPVVRTGIKTLTVGADVVPTMSATVKSMD